MAQPANAIPAGIRADAAPIRTRRLRVARTGGRRIRTLAEERNTRRGEQRREESTRNLTRDGGEGPSDLPTFQRISPEILLPLIGAAAAQEHFRKPNIRIPMSWWRSFLPKRAIDRTKLNPETGEYETIDHSTPESKRGRHLRELERLDIPAKTKNYVIDQEGRRSNIVANARPLILYKRTNTLDRPAREKRCSYGKIRDPTTNSWRCIKNPNHKKDD